MTLMEIQSSLAFYIMCVISTRSEFVPHFLYSRGSSFLTDGSASFLSKAEAALMDRGRSSKLTLMISAMMPSRDPPINRPL